MLVSLNEFKALIEQARKLFVLVELSPGNKIYLGITKSTIREYLMQSHETAVFDVSYEDEELFIGS